MQIENLLFLSQLVFPPDVSFSYDSKQLSLVLPKRRKSLVRSHKKTNKMRIVPVCSFCYDYVDLLNGIGLRLLFGGCAFAVFPRAQPNPVLFYLSNELIIVHFELIAIL